MANANYPINSAGSAAFVAVVSACVFAFLVPVCNANGFVQPLVVGVAAGIFAELSRRYMVRKLVANRNATDADTLLDVYVNGAQVGTIAAVDVISLKLEALSDPRHYAAQFANIVGFAGRGALAALILMPLLLFWYGVISAWVSPAGFQSSMSMIAHLQPTDLTRIAAQLLFITQILFMVLIGASFTLGVDLGLANVFRSAVHRRIRLKINCATEGTLHFSPVIRTAARVQPA
ncbi:hypothetical protein [Paraburkholderia fungorum]|uniref:hypothetical protein n=1 Tax=Paraburkholderia fungorum TaxID=134537 RepID=UPI00161EB276|nr:hypothetical protein [Paraburkholderia fungorum]